MNTGLSIALRRYRHVLARPHVLRFFLPAAVARLGVAMTGLAVMWAVFGASGSWSRAGAATGVFTLMDAVLGPQVARLIDQHGQARVLWLSVPVFLLSTTGLAMGSVCDGPTGVLLVLAGLAGATVPPVGALSTARWRTTLNSGDSLKTALSLEGALNDLTFLIGPVLVTTLGTLLAPWFGLAMAIVLVAAGIGGLLKALASEPLPTRGSSMRLLDRKLLTNPFLLLLAANLAMGLFFGGIGVAITAFAVAHNAPALAGVITAASGVVSLGAGLAYGAVGKGHPLHWMTVVSVMITLGTALLATVSTIPVMLLGYAVVGGGVALILIPASVLLHSTVHRNVLTQAITWINSASALGIGVAAPLIGHLIQRYGWATGFLVLAALTATLPAILLAGWPILNNVQTSDDGRTSPSQRR